MTKKECHRRIFLLIRIDDTRLYRNSILRIPEMGLSQSREIMAMNDGYVAELVKLGWSLVLTRQV